MPSRTLMLAAVMILVSVAAAAAEPSQGSICKPAGPMARLDQVPEASGLAVSRAAKDRLWLLNDSGTAELIAVDPSGKPQGRLASTGARVEEWEALASGPCGAGSCLYVADIGDNDAARKQITIYRIAEPAQASGSAKAEAFHAAYPDGAHDAEALLVAPDSTLFVVTKGDTGPVAVYRFPRQLQSGVMTLERVGKAIADKPGDRNRITDGAFSTDGRWVVLRTNHALAFYAAGDFMKGQFRESHRVDLSPLKEPQGEGVAFGAGSTVYIASEGGGKNQPGTLGALSCAP